MKTFASRETPAAVFARSLILWVASRDSSLPEQRTIQAVGSRCSLNVASTCFRQVIGKWQPRRDLNPCHRRERRCPLTEELKTGGWHHCLHVGEIQEQTHRTLEVGACPSWGGP